MNIGSWIGRIVRAGAADFSQRQYIYAQPQDTRTDVTTQSRKQVLGLARYWFYNSPVVRGAIDCMVRNSIGPGIKCQARTSDEGWNRATEEWFDTWMGSCDVRGLLDFNTMQQVATRTMLRDNEVFLILTSAGENGDWPQLQMVEAHRCETPPYLNGEKRVVDGVRVNPQGRPLSYYINLGDGDKFTEVQSTDLIVLAERDRADELRSLSRLVTCLNLIQDREEILTNTMVSVKRSSTIGLALEGEGSAGFFGPETTTTDGITTDRIFGSGAIWNVPNGRKIREIKDDRPSPNLTEFMDQFLRAVASGLGLPYEYLWKADLSGPSQRFVLAQAQRRFDEISQAIITQLVSRVRLWALAKAIKRGDLTPPRGMDRWWSAVYHTPKKSTIDAGRDSAADREDLKMGIRTLADIAAERGDDWQEILDQRKIEKAYESGGEVKGEPLITSIGIGGAQALSSIIQQIGQGLITPTQAETILITVFGMTEEAARKIAQDAGVRGTPPAAPSVTPPSAPPADEAPAQTPTPELANSTVTINMSAPVEITDPAAVLREEPEQKLTEAFTMKDDPDLELSDKELDMVVKAVGLKLKKAKKKKA
jgi:lambda family phage portal protein